MFTGESLKNSNATMSSLAQLRAQDTEKQGQHKHSDTRLLFKLSNILKVGFYLHHWDPNGNGRIPPQYVLFITSCNRPYPHVQIPG